MYPFLGINSKNILKKSCLQKCAKKWVAIPAGTLLCCIYFRPKYLILMQIFHKSWLVEIRKFCFQNKIRFLLIVHIFITQFLSLSNACLLKLLGICHVVVLSCLPFPSISVWSQNDAIKTCHIYHEDKKWLFYFGSDWIRSVQSGSNLILFWFLTYLNLLL